MNNPLPKIIPMPVFGLNIITRKYVYRYFIYRMLPPTCNPLGTEVGIFLS